jgi:hypothetical protein
MNRPVILSFFIASLFLAGCSANHPAAAAAPAGPKTVSVTTAQAVTRTVPAAFQETGTFVADNLRVEIQCKRTITNTPAFVIHRSHGSRRINPKSAAQARIADGMNALSRSRAPFRQAEVVHSRRGAFQFDNRQVATRDGLVAGDGGAAQPAFPAGDPPLPFPSNRPQVPH